MGFSSHDYNPEYSLYVVDEVALVVDQQDSVVDEEVVVAEEEEDSVDMTDTADLIRRV